MSICGVCGARIEDGKPYKKDNVSYCGCEEHTETWRDKEEEQ